VNTERCYNGHGHQVQAYGHRWEPGLVCLTPIELDIVRRQRGAHRDPQLLLPGDDGWADLDTDAAGDAPAPEAEPELSLEDRLIRDFGPGVEQMTKRELEAFARNALGLELDRRRRRADLVAQVQAALAEHEEG